MEECHIFFYEHIIVSMQFAKPSLLIQNLGKVFPWEKMLMFPNTLFCILILHVFSFQGE